MKSLAHPLGLSLFLACSAAQTTPPTIEEDVSLGPSLRATKYDQLYFSGQPTTEDLKDVKRAGIVAIVNLRPPMEHDWFQEKEVTQRLGMKYHSVPFRFPLTRAYIEEVNEILSQYDPSEKILIHCASGNRVGIWLGGHLHTIKKKSKEEAYFSVESSGLSRPGALEVLKTYLNQF